ncbi:MAG: hypothetical protein OXQ89_10065 [Rhodospirillaceae bacterium]|nr:hypothetical protein [Rhodospirillaceae bacterium]MDD9998076.1 hypothetical protein [Rhodospirillaceae bacterium]MDE0363831.1 hypothetical protein [Rhodospirillaceae bacterium]
MRRRLLIIGLTAIFLIVTTLLWERRVPVGPAPNIEPPPDPGVSPSEQPEEPAPAVSTDSTGSTDATDDIIPLWAPIDESTLAVLPPYAEDWSAEGRALVEVSDTDWLWAVQVGDLLALPVPQLGATYQAVVEEIDQGAGARALVGTITGSDGYRRRSVVTIGPASLLAFIDTPNGTYEFEIALDLQEHGWLVPSSSMLAGWDFNEPDYFINQDDDAGGGISP